MHRTKALALAGASTLVLGSGLVATAAMAGSFLGFGGGTADGVGSFTALPVAGASERHVPVRSRDVYDRYVVDVSGGPRGSSSGTATGSPKPAASPLGAVPGKIPISVSGGAPVALPDASRGREPTAATPTTVDATPSQPTPSTTGVTPTTRPPGVPADWPAGKAVPPMPPNCRQPQLEDNGVWNCQSDD